MTDHLVNAPPVPRWVQAFSPILKRILSAGLPLGPNALVTIRGRTSGEPRTTPRAVIDVDGRRWIWAPWGTAQWVRNLRVAGQATITVRGRAETVRAIELDAAQRVEFFRDVLGPMARSMPFGVQFVRIVDQVDVHDPVAAAEGRAVFELLPVP